MIREYGMRFGSSSRKWCVAIAVVAVAIVFGHGRRVFGDVPGAWSQFQGNAAHTGYNPGTIDPNHLAPLWSVSKTGLGKSSLVPGAATDSQHVYLTVYNHSFGGGYSGYNVLAFDRADGAQQWSAQIFSYLGPVSAPSVDNGTVWVHQWGDSSALSDPHLFGLSTVDGATKSGTSYFAQSDAGSRPTIADGQVFIAAGGSGVMSSYDATTGALQWGAGLNQQYGWIPAADSEHAYVYLGPAADIPGPPIGTLFAFDRVSGSLAYSIQNPADPHTLSQGTVVVGNQNDALTRTFDGLVSFDLDAQSVRWSLTGEYSGAMAIDDGIVFAANGGQLGLLDEATGNPIDFWSAPAGLTISSNVVVIDNLIFAGTTAGTYSIDRNTLTTVWSTPIAGDLAVGNDLILISNSESLHVFAVPEPAAAQLLVAGSAVLLAALTRRRRSPKSTASPTWSNTSQKKKFAPPASFASKAKPTSCRTATSATSYATKAFLAARPSLALEHRAER